MSIRRPSTRDKIRTPSPITIYSKEISKSKKASLYNRVQQISSRRGSSKQQTSKSQRQKSKYRIITEPLEHFSKIQHLVNSNIFGNTSFGKMPEKSLIQKHNHLSQKKIKMSRVDNKCSYCTAQKRKVDKLEVQLSYYKNQISKLTQGLSDWRQGKSTLQQFKNNTLKPENQKPNHNQISFLKSIIQQVTRDIQSLSKIDIIKLLKSQIFSYYPDTDTVSTKIEEAQDLLSQLKSNFINPINTEITKTSNSFQQSMLRNLRIRINQLLRQNLELKIKQQLFQEEISMTSVHSDQLKIAIHNAMNY